MSQGLSFDPRYVGQNQGQQAGDGDDSGGAFGGASAGEKFKEIAIYFFAGTGMLIGIVLLVFLITKLYDKLCSYCTTNYVLTPEELQERRNATSITKKAGLAGILPDEKNRALRHFFTKRSFQYVVSEEQKQKRAEAAAAKEQQQQQKAKEEEEERAKAKAKANELEKESSEGDSGAAAESTDATATKKSENQTETGTGTPSSQENEKGDTELQDLCMMEHEEGTCPICLQEYADGELIITGSSCVHEFHLECAMQWLEKGNDHCAYCRNDMIQPDELLKAAREELGDARVDKIVTINELASQRLRAYEAAMAQSADNTDTTRQLAASGALTVPPGSNDTTSADETTNAESPSTPTTESTPAAEATAAAAAAAATTTTTETA